MDLAKTHKKSKKYKHDAIEYDKYYILSTNKKILKDFLCFCFNNVEEKKNNFVCKGIKDPKVFEEFFKHHEIVKGLNKHTIIFEHEDFSHYVMKIKRLSNLRFLILILLGFVVPIILSITVLHDILVGLTFSPVIPVLIVSYLLYDEEKTKRHLTHYLSEKLKEFDKNKKYVDLYVPVDKVMYEEHEIPTKLIVESTDLEKILKIHDEIRSREIFYMFGLSIFCDDEHQIDKIYESLRNNKIFAAKSGNKITVITRNKEDFLQAIDISKDKAHLKYKILYNFEVYNTNKNSFSIIIDSINKIVNKLSEVISKITRIQFETVKQTIDKIIMIFVIIIIFVLSSIMSNRKSFDKFISHYIPKEILLVIFFVLIILYAIIFDKKDEKKKKLEEIYQTVKPFF